MLLPVVAVSQQFEGGLMAGLVGSQVAGDRYSGYNKAGLMGGGYVSLKVAPKYDLKMELQYIQKGSRHNFDPDVANDIDYKLRVDYVEMPLLAAYSVSGGVIRVETGLAMAVLVSHKEFQNDLDISKNLPAFKSTNLSFILGASYQLSDHFRVNVRTDNSLLPVRKDSFSGNVRRIFSDWGQYHDLLLFSLFYKLG